MHRAWRRQRYVMKVEAQKKENLFLKKKNTQWKSDIFIGFICWCEDGSGLPIAPQTPFHFISSDLKI